MSAENKPRQELHGSIHTSIEVNTYGFCVGVFSLFFSQLISENLEPETSQNFQLQPDKGEHASCIDGKVFLVLNLNVKGATWDMDSVCLPDISALNEYLSNPLEIIRRLVLHEFSRIKVVIVRNLLEWEASRTVFRYVLYNRGMVPPLPSFFREILEQISPHVDETIPPLIKWSQETCYVHRKELNSVAFIGSKSFELHSSTGVSSMRQ